MPCDEKEKGMPMPEVAGSHADAMALPARLIHTHEECGGVYRQCITPATGNLELLHFGTWTLSAGFETDPVAAPGLERLYFVTTGSTEAWVEGAPFRMNPRDCLYVPAGATHRFRARETAELACFGAPADKTFPAYVTHFADVPLSGPHPRLRKLKGKDVVVLCGEQDDASNFIAGWTFFDAVTRSFPPHKHEDQEEIYFFVEGRGAMEVYRDEENKSFVREVGPGDVVTIPRQTFHPVYSYGQPVTFIWVIAGARYWVGDRDQAFTKAAR